MTSPEHVHTTEDPTATAGSGPRVRPATFDHLRKKKRRERVVPITSVDDDGDEIVLEVRMRAISGKAYDKLVASCPPTPTQKENGNVYDVDRFAPALISAVCTEPVLSVEQATEIWTSEEWSSGETGGLFVEALRLCNAGLDVPFRERG